ncbi:hypothetical protein FWH13_03120 [Candidatus Saccharibacteria bacterium]|nr:hypothetical protein [Candidatus Saccharibacteria bacterium]
MAETSSQKGFTSTKHSMIDRANYLVFVAVAVTALILGFCGVGIWYLSNMLAFQGRVIAAKSEALDNITVTKANLDSIRLDLELLAENDSLLSMINQDDERLNRTQPLRLVANALPVGENVEAFGSNLSTLSLRLGDEFARVESIAPGGLDGLGTDEGAVSETTAMLLPFSMTAVGSLGCADVHGLCLEPTGLSLLLSNFERSIRSVYVNQMTMSFREGDTVEMVMNGHGFFTMERTFTMGNTTISGRDRR